MIFPRKLEKVYYTDLDELSIYNWSKLIETNDYKWICRPKRNPDYRAVGVYQMLLFQFDELNLDILEQKKQIMLQIIDLVIEISKDKNIKPEILDVVSILLQALIIDPQNADIDMLLKMLKNPDHKFKLSFIANEKKKLQESAAKQSKPTTINERAATITKYLGAQIDIKKTSVKQFHAYENQMIKEYKNKR